MKFSKAIKLGFITLPTKSSYICFITLIEGTFLQLQRGQHKVLLK